MKTHAKCRARCLDYRGHWTGGRDAVAGAYVLSLAGRLAELGRRRKGERGAVLVSHLLWAARLSTCNLTSQ